MSAHCSQQFGRISRRTLCVIGGLLLCLWNATAHAGHTNNSDPNTGMDVVLLMDSSGSMKQTDPQSLRKPAAKLFLSLLGENDHASVVSFSDNGYPILYLHGTADDTDKQKLHDAVEKISSLGVYTNLYRAIAAAQRVLEKDGTNERRKLIILMSDGKMDTGTEQQSQQATEKLFAELLPKINAANIELQTIAFSEQSDKALLAKIASETSGKFFVAASDKELHNTFAKIFEGNTQPNMLPFDEGSFQIDESIREVTIIGSKDSAEVTLSLISPMGENFSHAQPGENMKWQVSSLFDLITIKHPERGNWHLKASNNNNKAYIITNLQLGLGIQPEKPLVDEPIQIQAWLEKDSEVLIKEEILNSLLITAEIISPDGQVGGFPLKAAGNGVHQEQITLPTPGQYEIILTADSGTFKRKRNIIFEVEEHAEAVNNTVKTETETINQEPTEPPKEAEPISAEQTEDNDGTLKTALYIFLVVNLILTVIIGGIVLWRKRKRKAS